MAMSTPKSDADQAALPMTRQTKFLCIDVETNGLHGEAFAVGAVLIQADTTVLDNFLGRCPIKGEVDAFVKKNLLAPMEDVPEDYPTALDLRNAFWAWNKQAKARADYVLADSGYPVEARFFSTCQDDNLEERYWDHPYPLIDVASLLLAAGIKPLAVKRDFVADRLPAEIGNRHEPRSDAWISALAAIKALEMSGQLK